MDVASNKPSQKNRDDEEDKNDAVSCPLFLLKNGIPWNGNKAFYNHVTQEETNINVVVRCRGRNERAVQENSGVVQMREFAGEAPRLGWNPAHSATRFITLFSSNSCISKLWARNFGFRSREQEWNGSVSSPKS
jgi:hypothetical protein